MFFNRLFEWYEIFMNFHFLINMNMKKILSKEDARKNYNFNDI